MQERSRQRNLDPIQDSLYDIGMEFIAAKKRGNVAQQRNAYKVFLQLFGQRYIVDGLPLPPEEVLPSSQLEVLDIIYDTQLLSWIGTCCQVIERKNSRRLGNGY